MRQQFIRKFTAIISIYLLCLSAVSFGVTAAPAGKALTEDQKILHILNRLGFGARPGDIEKVKKLGIEKYIDQQLNPSTIDDSVADTKVKSLEVFGMTTAEVFAKYPNPGALLRQLEGGRQAQANNAAQQNPEQMTEDQQRQRRQKLNELYREYDLRPAAQLMPQVAANRVLRAVYSERQLQEVMVDFWQNHFNVFSGKAAVRWYIPSYERDVLRKNALGNFKDLLTGTAQHPAMLFYLDNFESVSPTAQTPNRPGNGRLRQPLRPQQQQQQRRPQRGINENYARELMELHTLGVDGGYTQTDIVEVAKAFTGWTIADPRGYRRSAANMITGEENRRLDRLQRLAGVPDDLESGEFYFNERWHEKGSKSVLGQKIDEGGVKDGLKVIDILVEHPSTAKFIAKKLAVKFVSDKPSQALVDRVADAFHKSHGDIKTTLKALFTDKEFFAPENYRAKIKTPFELAISSIRALGADTNGSPAFLAMLNKLGEVPYGYQAPTGYPDTAEDWVNTGALLERLNYAIAVASNRIPGTTVDLKRFQASSKEQTLDKAVEVILNGEISLGTSATLKKQIQQPLPEVKEGTAPADNDDATANMQPAAMRNRQARLLPPKGDPEIFKVISLVLGSPEFQRQ